MNNPIRRIIILYMRSYFAGIEVNLLLTQIIIANANPLLQN
jgi:hypothetical protein